jgi:hypothetical protein
MNFIGPKIDAGPLPAIFYFALSAQESLQTDPYNQPVIHLSRLPVRIFSIDIPGHGGEQLSKEALQNWVEPLRRKENIIVDFAKRTAQSISTLIEQGVVVKEACGAMGLSRGVLIAAHVAAQLPAIRYLLGFAPLTKITQIQEFAALKEDPFIQSLDMIHLSSLLKDRTIRFYIGNRDIRVGVRNCFDCIEKFAEDAYAAGVRSAPIELLIKPSIGFQGHGTAPRVFEEGADWIASQLGLFV